MKITKNYLIKLITETINENSVDVDFPVEFKKLENHYDIKKEKDAYIIQVKGGKDFPYKIKGNILYQGFSPRKGIPVKFYQRTKGDLKKITDYIVKKHNKADEYMKWGKI
jgi:hypothetical protein